MATVHVWSNMSSGAPLRACRFERPRLKLSSLVRRCGLDPRREVVIAQHNGRWVRQRDWHRTLAGRNDVVHIVLMPADGEVGRTVAQIAVLIVSAVVAPQLVAPLGLTGAALTAATAATTAALSIAGSYAVNALIPLPRPNAPGLSTALGSLDAESPTYAFSVSSQQNLARLGGPIPEWFGYHRVIPDVAATAWWEWSDGKQTLYQTLCLTRGSLDVEKIEIGRIPIGTFEEIDHALFEPGSPANLFEPEVYQSPDVGSILLNPPNDLPAGDDGIYGPFPATPSGQQTDRIGVDISFPRGLYLQSGGSLAPKTAQWRVEARLIDDAGAPAGVWFTVANETFDSDPSAVNGSTPEIGISGQFMGGGYASANKLSSPLTISYRYTLAASARHEIRLRRLDNKDLSFAAGHDVVWSGLRGFLGGGNYGDVTVLQVAVTATASVNDRTVRQIAVTATRKLPVWNGAAWSLPVATRSIAWAAAHVIRSDNGGRQPDANFDLDALFALDGVWSARGDYFDYYASSHRPLWEMLQTVLRAGRAVPYRQGSQVRFFRDAPAAIPATGFSRQNIVQRSFTTKYRMPEPEDDADGIEVRYFDSRTWNFNALRKAFAGAAAPVRPLRRSLDGVIEIAQAQRELDYYVAEYNLRPVSIEFDTEMEGMLPSYGDIVLVQHDAPRWGLSNRVLDWNAATRVLALLAPPIWTFGEGWYARIRDVRGRYSAPILIVQAPSSTSIVLGENPVYDDAAPFDFTLSDSELLHVMLGQSADTPRLARFREMTPRGGRKFNVRAVIEDPAVHVN